MKNNGQSCPDRYQKGAGMVEVLVSLLVLAIGLLGVLSLQARGLNSNQRAVFVTDAQLLAQDMADRIQAFGSVGSNSNGGVNTNLYAAIDVTGEFTGTAPSTCNNCDGDATLALDQNQWHQALSDSSLPRGRARVTWASPIYTVQVMWDQERTGQGAIECNNDNCFSIQVRVEPPVAP